MSIAFLLNGESVEVSDPSPTETLLDWLRERRGLKGTKEGCNEGDCGACTVMVQDALGTRALNACILFLPQLDGKRVTTVEGLAAPDGRLHPVQQAMIDHHGSQCGFCTPGFVVSMAAAQIEGQTDPDLFLAGNLCRCTGYAPIARAWEAVRECPVPDWLTGGGEAAPAGPADKAPPEATGYHAPRTAEELAATYAAHPEATLVAGATDVGLWVTKALREIAPVIFLGRCDELRGITVTEHEIRIGALASVEALRRALAGPFPAFSAMLARFGSLQVRHAATVGGNIANGSPIGDTPPPLIALGARLHLRQGARRRTIPLEDFFIDYGRQDRAPGEFVEAVTIPRRPGQLFVHKVSKRFDQDISTLLGAFWLDIRGGRVAGARIAFGGMAGTPKRAEAVEAALIGQPWSAETVEAALPAFGQDFTPIDDMRGSAAYRMAAAQNLLRRVWHESRGETVSVREVRP